MRRRELLAATGGIAATTMAGCVGSSEPDEPAGTEGPTVEERSGRSVVVSNTGETTGDPDLAIVEAGVEARGDAAGAVRDDLSSRSDDLREALLEYGIPEDAITTEHFRIHEEVDRQQMERDEVPPDSEEAIEEYTFYRGSHSFTVEVEDIDAVGEVIDTAVDAGADQVGRVTYTLSDERRADLRETALQSAIQDARSEAETIAAEVDGSIVEATVVDASEGQVSPVRRDLSYAVEDAAATPSPATNLDPGDVTVTASVRIEYEME